jgi:hypothetical protein
LSFVLFLQTGFLFFCLEFVLRLFCVFSLLCVFLCASLLYTLSLFLSLFVFIVYLPSFGRGSYLMFGSGRLSCLCCLGF